MFLINDFSSPQKLVSVPSRLVDQTWAAHRSRQSVINISVINADTHRLWLNFILDSGYSRISLVRLRGGKSREERKVGRGGPRSSVAFRRSTGSWAAGSEARALLCPLARRSGWSCCDFQRFGPSGMQHFWKQRPVEQNKPDLTPFTVALNSSLHVHSHIWQHVVQFLCRTCDLFCCQGRQAMTTMKEKVATRTAAQARMKSSCAWSAGRNRTASFSSYL